MAEVTWVQVRIETPPEGLDSAAGFWAAATGATVRPGPTPDVVLVSDSGSSFVTLRPTDRLRWSVSLVLEADDPAELGERALGAGARRAGDDGFRSPGDFRFDIAAAAAPRHRPAPVTLGGTRSRLDQVCVDCPPRVFEDEIEFWSQLTGWSVGRGGLSEFAWLARPEGLPVRLLFQELGDGHRGRRVRAHLDLACGTDVDRLILLHESLGATRGTPGRVWHTMSDPSGLTYCLTERDPDSGIIDRPL